MLCQHLFLVWQTEAELCLGSEVLAVAELAEDLAVWEGGYSVAWREFTAEASKNSTVLLLNIVLQFVIYISRQH